MASKGKAIADNDSSGKRKRKDEDDKGGSSSKRRNRDILQFFEDSAAEFDGADSDQSDDFFDIDDFLNDDFTKVKSEPGRFDEFPFFPKEEELSGDELEKMLAERYRTRSGYVRYAEDDFDTKRSVDKSFLISSVAEPTIWKVKCKVGREKNTVFCLIQKFMDLKALGTKLQIISAFAVEHIKGFVFVEAEKQSDVAEACNQLADVYFSLVTKIPSNEVGKLLVVKKRYNEVKEGTWARVKNGIYRGDLAQVVAVNNERKRATVKLVPRIDLQALTVKYGGGAISKRTKGSIPAARLISSRDLEEFRPLIQYRRDRDTGKMYEFLDSLMLKDGFLYKKVSIDSLSFWGVNPSEDELQKFAVPINDESDNVEWLSQLYGEQKKCNMKIDRGGGKGEGSSGKGGGKGEGSSGKGGEKGEGSSGSHEQSSFEVHDLVLFGKRDFGMVIGLEKDDSYKIIKDGSDGPVILTLAQKAMKYMPQDKKFTALDHRMKTISINDTVKILDGPSKERQGIVKQIYRGIIFLYDENDLDNAYFCTKSQISEKVKHADIACHGKDEGGPSSFEDIPSSPKSPLSPKKTWQPRENYSEGKDEQFSIGQSLRIRIGPLKGYLCRVLAIRYSDVTVKLDSKQKVLTVKRDHLAEVRGKSSASLIGGDPESSSPFKPFDLLGTEGTTNDWLQPVSGSAEGDDWNVGGLSTERSAWPAFPSSGASLQGGTSATDLHSSVDNGNTNDGWLSKVAVGNERAVDDDAGAWGNASGWGKEKALGEDHGGSWNISRSSLSEGKTCDAANSWGTRSAETGHSDSWDKEKRTEEKGGFNDIGSCDASGSSGWGKQKACINSTPWGGATEFVKENIGNVGGDAWAEPKSTCGLSEGSWGKAADGWGKKNNVSEGSGWGSSAAAGSQSQTTESGRKGSDPWGKVANNWGNKDGSEKGNGWGNSTNKAAGNSWAEPKSTCGPSEGSWGKEADGWGKKNNVSEGSGWGSSAVAGSQSQAKESEEKGPDPWGKVADKWGNKDGSEKGSGWGKSTNKAADEGVKGWGCSSGGWTNSQKENAEAGGGWKSSGSGAGDSWSKPGGFGNDRVSSFHKAGGTDSWSQSKESENGGFSRGRGPGGRGRGRDQCGRGRGRSFDGGQSSGFNKGNLDNYSSGSKGWSDQHVSSWGNSSAENIGQTSSWGKGKGWNNDKGDDIKGWKNSSEPNKDVGGWSSQNVIKGWSSGGGAEEKPADGGGSSWGGGNTKKSGWGNDPSNNGQHSALSKPPSGNWASGGGAEEKPADGGGSSWAGGNNKKSGWGNDPSNNGQHSAVSKPPSRNWASDGGAEEKPADGGGSSWGGGNNKKSGWGNDPSNNGQRSAVSKPPSGNWASGGGAEEKPADGGGSSWGGGNNQKSGWGNASSNNGQHGAVSEPPSGNWAAGQAGSSWKNSQAGRSSDGGGGWGT